MRNLLSWLTCIVAMVLAGCAVPPVNVLPGTEIGKESTAPPAKVKLVMLPFMSFAPFFIAQEEGFFLEQNIELELVELQASTDAVPPLIQGEIDVVAGFLRPNILNGVARGSTVKAVADKGFLAAEGCTYIGLLANRALVENGELVNAADLKGRRIAFDPVGFEGYYIERLLAQAGLSLDDIEVVNIPQAAKLDALADGSVDLVSTSEPWYSLQLAGGSAVSWVSAQTVLPNGAMSFVYYGPTLLEQNPDVGVRFMVAYLKGVHQYNEGKTERNLAILAKHIEMEPGLLRETCWPPIQEDAHINVESVQDFQHWGLAAGLLDKELAIDQIWTPQFVEAASQLIKDGAE